VVLRKGPPRLRGWSSPMDHVFAYAGLSDVDSQLQKLAVNPRALQIGFSRLIVRINSRISNGTRGLPGLPRRIFQVQNKRKPLRCQPITVAALMIKIPDRHSFQTADNQAHSIRSVGVSFGRFTDRCRTPSWWRSARISICRAIRLRKDARTVTNSAAIIGTHQNRRRDGNPQTISHFGVYENHNVPDTNWSIGPTGKLRSWRLAYVLLVKPWFTWTTSDQNISWHSRLRMPNSKSNCH
jgi:hypothetical protein